jgi:chromosome segregation ATPase
MKRCVQFLIFAILLSCLSENSFILYAEEGKDTGTTRLEEINVKVDQQTEELNVTRERLQVLLQRQKALQEQMKGITAKENALAKQLEIKRFEVETLKNDLQATTSQIEKIQQLAIARLKALYMQRNEDVLERMLVVSNTSNMQKNSYFLSKIRKQDNRLLSDFAKLVKDKKAKIGLLDKALLVQDSLREAKTRSCKTGSFS